MASTVESSSERESSKARAQGCVQTVYTSSEKTKICLS